MRGYILHEKEALKAAWPPGMSAASMIPGTFIPALLTQHIYLMLVRRKEVASLEILTVG